MEHSEKYQYQVNIYLMIQLAKLRLERINQIRSVNSHVKPVHVLFSKALENNKDRQTESDVKHVDPKLIKYK